MSLDFIAIISYTLIIFLLIIKIIKNERDKNLQ